MPAAAWWTCDSARLACRTGGRRGRRHGDQAGADRAGEPRHRASMRRRELGHAAGRGFAHEQAAAQRRGRRRRPSMCFRSAPRGRGSNRSGAARGRRAAAPPPEARCSVLRRRRSVPSVARAAPGAARRAAGWPSVPVRGWPGFRRAGGPAIAAGRPAPAGGSARATRTADRARRRAGSRGVGSAGIRVCSRIGGGGEFEQAPRASSAASADSGERTGSRRHGLR